MSVDIAARSMQSTATGHTAEFDESAGGWRLSWLPGRVLTKDQAVSGMVLADVTDSGLVPGDERWPILDATAAELGLSGPEAVVRVSTSDEVREQIARAEQADQAEESGQLVVACSACELDFDDQADAPEASYFARTHNELHHGGRVEAVVAEVDPPSERPAESTPSGATWDAFLDQHDHGRDTGAPAARELADAGT